MQVQTLHDRIVATPADAEERRYLMSLPNAHLRKDGSFWYPLEWTTLGSIILDRGHGVLTMPTMSHWLEHQKELAYLSSIKFDSGSTADFILERVPWVRKLYPYQLRGAAWLATARRGILSDEPGLGKTLQAITAIESKRSFPALIVTMNGVKQHWAQQIQLWTGCPAKDIAVAQGDAMSRVVALAGDQPWVIVNHEMLRTANYEKMLLGRQWGTVVVDEAHKLQGRHSQVSEKASRLRTQNLFLLTGTPVWNKPDSIWRLLYLLDPARFRSYWQFVDEYCITQQTPWAKEVVGINPKMMNRLQALLASMVYGRKKSEVLPDLPEKIITDIPYDLTPAQAKAYTKLKRHLTLELEDGTETYYNAAIEVVSKLRQMCNAPSLVGSKGISAKTDVIATLIEQLTGEGRKIVVFTWHKNYATYLLQQLYHWGAVCVTGDQSAEQRDQLVQYFRRSDECQLLIATIGAVGTGIDLIEATAAIFAEGSYTPSHNLQAEDRLHRIGIHDSPLIYRLWARGTVEEALWETNDDRRDQADEMFNLRAILGKALDPELEPANA